MKTKIIHFNILLLIFSLSFWHSMSQCQTNYHTFHYPLSIGDIWQYHITSGIEYIETIEVIGDTIAPNENCYKIMEIESGPFGISHAYLRVVDSVGVYQLIGEDEQLIIKLKIKAGTTWKYPFPKQDALFYGPLLADSGFVRVDSVNKEHIFRKNRFVCYASSFNLPDSSGCRGIEFTFADSIGVVLDGFEIGWRELEGAIINGISYGALSNVSETKPKIPESIELYQNYPNPFNNETILSFSLPQYQHVNLSIFNISGQLIKTLLDQAMESGYHAIIWKGTDQNNLAVASGIYICKLTGYRISMSKKIILTR